MAIGVLIAVLDTAAVDGYLRPMHSIGKAFPPGIVSISSKLLGGEPVFDGTRVPVKTMLDYLEAGDALDLFLYDFPTVSRHQAVAVLEWAKESLLTVTA